MHRSINRWYHRLFLWILIQKTSFLIYHQLKIMISNNFLTISNYILKENQSSNRYQL